MTNSVSLAFLPSSALNWPRCVARLRLLLHDQPGQSRRRRRPARWLTELTSAAPRAGLALDDRRLGAVADAHRQAHMRLAAGLHVLQFDRLFELGAVGDVDEIAVGDEGGVERADGIVGCRADRAPAQSCRRSAFRRRRCTVDALDRQRLCRRDAVEQRQHRRAFDERRDGLGVGRRVVRRHRASAAGADRCSARPRRAGSAGRP